MALTLKRTADRANASVHHVRGRHHIGTSRRMTERLFDQRVTGHIVQYITGLVDDAVLTVGGVGVQRNVGDDADLRYRRLQFGHRTLYQSVSLIGSFGQQ